MKIEIAYDGVPSLGIIPENFQDVQLLARLNLPNNLRVDYRGLAGSGMWLAPALVREGEFPMPVGADVEWNKISIVARSIINSMRAVTLSVSDADAVLEELTRITHGWKAPKIPRSAA
jgi:hypothetical protein